MARIIEVTDLNAPGLEAFANLTERELFHQNKPECGIFIAESPNVIHRALDAGFEPISLLMEQSQVAKTGDVLERCGDIPLYTSSMEVLSKLTGFKLTRGVLCAMRRVPELTLDEALRGAKRVTVLEDVVNPTNLGAIFRSAAALGMDAVLLTPGCCDPLYRRCIRVSMGTVFQTPWAHIGEETTDWPHPGMEILKEHGFKTVAMALKNDSVAIDDPALAAEEKLAIILGTEGDGLADSTIAACDFTVKIPMSHGVDSLNVAAASAVAYWQLGRR
ncbi:MAG: RNA methyltransferase [Clostridia bacterium]|nr:RNA methyltransferase [Clostridia bacterium]MBR5942601.1 RNA methyltransferase [Clostridia bacterium]